MKSRLRLIAAVALAALLSIYAPVVFAQPKDGTGRDLPAKVVKLIKKIQGIFGVSTQSDYPLPPRP